MPNDNKTLRIRIDAYTRLCLTAIAVLLTVLIMGLWADFVPLAGSAQAKGPFLDSGSQTQLVELLKAQQTTNARLGELTKLFRSGQAKVQLANPPAQAKGVRNVLPVKTKK